MEVNILLNLESKSDFTAWFAINYFPVDNNFPADDTLLASRYSIDIAMANVQTSYIT